MLEIKINESEGSAKIVVVGVGGAGNNAVIRMVGHDICNILKDLQVIDLELIPILGLTLIGFFQFRQILKNIPLELCTV